MASLAGRPLFAWSLEAFEESPPVDSIVVVAAPDRVDEFRRAVSAAGAGKVAVVVGGGARRQDSVACGLQAVPGVETVLVHDGARPLVSADLIARVLEALPGNDGVAPALPVTDTVKEVGEDHVVVRTADRARLWAVQTPQAFLVAKLREALDAAERDGVEGTDDASLVERIGGRVVVVEGVVENFKVTYPHDLAVAEALLAARAARALPGQEGRR